jgi:type IV pilus assembly protein PilY1
MLSVINKTFFLTLLLSVFMTPLYALNMAQSPLSLGNLPPPNILLLLDDSGSMDWDITTTKHWRYCNYQSMPGVSCSTSAVINGGFYMPYNNSFREYQYVYNNADNLYSECGSYGTLTGSCPPQVNDWRIFSSDLNVVWYNPNKTYLPWNGPCLSNDALCPAASFSSARSNPVQNSSGYNNTRNLSSFVYEIWKNDHGFSGSYPTTTTSTIISDASASTDSGVVDLWDSHITITVNSHDIIVSSTTYLPTAASVNPTTIVQAILSDTNACYDILGDKDSALAIFTNNSSYTATDGNHCRTLEQTRQNVANWYEFHRKRSQISRHAITSIITQYPFMRYGLRFLNNNTMVIMPPAGTTDFTAQNTSLLSTLYTVPWGAYGTPSRSGLKKVGQYYAGQLSGTSSPITAACQQNFTFFFTDGHWSDESFWFGNKDSDPYSHTLADVARHYYTTNIAPAFTPGLVPTNAWDNNANPHMVTYTMGFGLTGNLIAGMDGWPTPLLTESSHWGGNPFDSEASRVDDLWHTAFNSKGLYFNANSETEILSGISLALSNISARANSSLSSVAQNTSILQTNTAIYQALFDSRYWSGSLLSYGISATGLLNNAPNWNANCVLSGGNCLNPAQTGLPGLSASHRVILTSDWAHNGSAGIPFRWPNDYTTLKDTDGLLPPSILSLLQYAPYAATTAIGTEIASNQLYGSQVINYLRGDRSLEQGQVNGTFRLRQDGVLGDIIHSAPLYVGAPHRIYPDSLESSPYSLFKHSQSTRLSIIYTGAGDGMLHGFEAISGVEKLAYIPAASALFANLPSLSLPSYSHHYFVDGESTEGDVFINGQWKSILIGSLGAGGKGIYALDITDPSQFSESNAHNLVLWEFTDKDDADLGYTFSKASITKMANGQWAAIFGNGYNNSSGQAALYILFIEEGVNDAWSLGNTYIKIPVGGSAPTELNGLSTPYVVDTNKDFVSDYIYAGDLYGRIWKFDVRSNSPAAWNVATANYTTPFFQASQTTFGDQAITTSPIVGPHYNGLSHGLMIYFGTGKYLEITDNDTTNTATQTFYALWDKLDGTVPQANTLLNQSILQENTFTFNVPYGGTSTVTARESSRTPIDFTVHDGWKIDLTVPVLGSRGERVNARPLLRNNHIIFTTLIPSSATCIAGGDSWLMELDAFSGAGLQKSPFDFNKDQLFTTDDFISATTSTTSNPLSLAASGVRSTIGIMSTPSVFLAADRKTEYKILSGSSGSLSVVTENPSLQNTGRQTWTQLR